MMNLFTTHSRRLMALTGIVTIISLVGGGLTATAQTPIPDSFPAPPVSIGPRFGPAQPTGSIPPVNIAPIPVNQPVFYPPAYAFDGRPVFVGPPVYGPVYAGPFGPAPVAVGGFGPPPPPIPLTANYAATGRPESVEVRRPAGPANLRVTIGEAFLNRVIARETVQPGPVRDVILGAQVTGRQTTVSRLKLDLKPSTDKASAQFILNGDVQTMTTGVTPQAMIDTAGQQQFFAVKDVFFDGNQFSTRHATVYIRANNQTVGAMTPLTGTLFGGLADRIAYRAAERQKAAGEAVARDKLAERLFPTFDGEVDANLAQGNRKLEPLRKWLESAKLMPASQSVWTSDTQMVYEALVSDDKTGSDIAPLGETAAGDNTLQLSIHESLLNTLVDRAGLKGYKTTDKHLRDLERQLLPSSSDSSQPEADLGSQETLKAPTLPSGTDSFVTDIELDEFEPLTFRLERDRLLVIIKATFKPAGQAVMPPMTVTIPYQTQLVGNSIRLAAGKPQVVAQDRKDPDAPQTIMEMAVQKVIEADLDPVMFDRALPAALWTGSGPAPKVASIKSDNGWVTISID